MQMNQDDRDILIRLDQNVKNFISKMDVHIKTDEDCFKEQGKDIAYLKKITYMGMGALIIVNVFLKFIKIGG